MENQETQPVGLGDLVASGLEALGITKDAVQAIASKVGIHDCGCDHRRAALNKLGKSLLGGESKEKPIDPP